MNGAKILLAAVALAAVGIGTVAAAYSSDVSDASEAQVPRYADTCAHGHNGFACKAPKHVSDIDELKERVYDLEADMQDILGPS